MIKDLANITLSTQNLGITEDYEDFVNKNLLNISIIKKYCQEITASPFEEMIQTDIAMGKWLEDTTSRLSEEILPMISELSRFRIDTSILDIYRNLLQLIGKRYALLQPLVVSL